MIAAIFIATTGVATAVAPGTYRHVTEYAGGYTIDSSDDIIFVSPGIYTVPAAAILDYKVITFMDEFCTASPEVPILIETGGDQKINWEKGYKITEPCGFVTMVAYQNNLYIIGK